MQYFLKKYFISLFFRIFFVVIIIFIIFFCCSNKYFVFSKDQVYNNQINILPNSFSTEMNNNSELIWHEINNAFYQDLSASSNLNEFNFENSVYIYYLNQGATNYRQGGSVTPIVSQDDFSDESFDNEESPDVEYDSGDQVDNSEDQQFYDIDIDSEDKDLNKNQDSKEREEEQRVDESAINTVEDVVSDGNDHEDDQADSNEKNNNQSALDQVITNEEVDDNSINQINDNDLDSQDNNDTTSELDTTDESASTDESDDSSKTNNNVSIINVIKSVKTRLSRLFKNIFNLKLVKAEDESLIFQSDLEQENLEQLSGELENNDNLKQSLIFTDFSMPLEYKANEIGSVKLKLSLAAQSSNPDDKLLIEYEFSDTWHILGNLNLNQKLSNASNGDYWQFDLTNLHSWDDLGKLKVKISYLTDKNFVGDNNSGVEVYLDAIWLTVDYNIINDIDVDLGNEIDDNVKGEQDQDNAENKKYIDQEIKKEIKELEVSHFNNLDNLSHDILKTNDKFIDFIYTDENKEENLIIKTDKKIYNGLTQADVYFNVTNIGKKTEAVNFQVHFPNGNGFVSEIEKWTENIFYEVEVPEYAQVAYYCEDGWVETVKTQDNELAEYEENNDLANYQCLSINEYKRCDSLSDDGMNCYKKKVKIGTRSERRLKNSWKKLQLSETPIKDKRNFLQKLLKLGPKKKSIPNNFKVNKSTDKQNSFIKAGETKYFKIKINFSANSSGEFYIEAIGDKKGYGLLDPWWDSEWNYKRPVTVTYSGSNLTDYQILTTIDTASIISEGKMQSDCDDIRFLDSNEGVDDELDYWIESGTCSTTATRIWTKVPSITGNKTIYMYYGNATTTGASSGSDTFVYFNDFETSVGFDAGDLNPATSTDSAKYGTYGIEANGQGLYRQEIRNGIDSGRDLVWETWVRGSSTSSNCSLSGIGIGHPSTGDDRDGYQAYIDERDVVGIRLDFQSGSILCSDSVTVDWDTWYFVSFYWTSNNVLGASFYTDPSSSPIGSCETSHSTYSDGEYGVAAYKIADWDDYRVRKYASSTVSTNIGNELDQSANLMQIHYRWRNDDGSESAATWATSEDNAITGLEQNEIIRLRFEVSNEGAQTSSSTTYRIEYGQKETSCSAITTWYGVPNTSSLHWQMANSTYLTDGGATTNVTSGLTDENISFLAGQTKDTSNTTSGTTLTNSQFTEIEYSIKPTFNSNANNSYCFRLTNSGIPLTSYNVYPEASLSVNWWDSWNYRKPVDIYNASSSLSDFQIYLEVDTKSLIDNNKLQSDCDDIRFVDSDEITQIFYWIEDGCNSTSTKIWIKIPTLATTSTTTIYMYYDNDGASQGSDCINTFMFCDNFNDGNDDGWTELNGTWNVSSNTYYQSSDLTTYMRSYNGQSSWEDYILETEIKINSGGSTGGFAGVLFRYNDSDNHYAAILDDRTSEGSIWIRRWLSGSYSGTQWDDIVIDRDTWYDLRVDVHASGTVDAIKTYFNGVTHEDTSWNDFSDGKIALMMHGTQAYYDDVRVRKYRYEDLYGSLGSEQVGPSISQIHYRWRNDDGSETGAIWRALEDSSTTINKNVPIRIRLETHNTGSTTSEVYQYRLEYGQKNTTCSDITSWIQVPTDYSQHWQMVDSSYLTDGASSTNVSNGLTDEGSSFTAGQLKDTSNQTGNIALAGNQFTEIEYSIKATDNAIVNNNYCFRLTNIGAPLDSYDKYAEIQVQVSWWNSNWTYRKSIDIDNTNNNNTLTEYQIYLEINNSIPDFWNHIKSDGSDIRFIGSNDSTVLDYWIQYWDYTATSASIWVQVDSIPATSTTWIYMYYGNEDAETTSDEYDPFTYSSMQDIFYAVNNDLAGVSVEVVSLIDNNEVQLDSQSSVNLSRQGMTNFSSVASTSVLKIKGPVHAKLIGDDNVDALVPISFASTLFTVPSSRGSESFYVYAPFANASTTLYNGSSWINDYSFNQDNALTISSNISANAILEADVPILLSFDNDGPYDGLIQYPATTMDLYGIRTNNYYIGITTNNTDFIIYCSGGTSNTLSNQSRGARISNNTCTGGSEASGNANAIRLTGANYGIGSIQQGDGDGGESTTFLPPMEFGTEYMLPTNTAYIAVVCAPDQGTVNLSIYDENNSFVSTSTCTGSGNYPGIVRSGTNDSNTYSAGSRIVSTNNKPFYAFYEDITAPGASGGDENNLWAAVQSRKYSYPHPDFNYGHEEFSSAPEFTQNYYRWYENLDNLTPTTAWSGINENTVIGLSNSPPGSGDVLRLRMSLQVGNGIMTAGTESFKLQYGEGSSCSAISTWYDVGQIASSTIWRGYNNATPIDGATLPSTLLSVSDVVETYEEENNSITTPNQINVGQDGEWDWIIENNGANVNTSYCFRIIKSNGNVLDNYTRYPKLTTNASPNTPTLTKLFDNEKISTTTPIFSFSATDSNNNDLVYQFQWSTDFDFTSSTTKSSDSNQGFSNITTPTDNSPFDSGDVIQFKIQSGDALTNNTTYWWRVRAKDPNGANQWGNWSVQRSLTVDTSVTYSTWFQTTDEQFDTNILTNVETTGSDSVYIRETIGEYGTTTVTGETANTITLQNTYTNLIVVASPRYGASQVYRDARIVNKTSTSFDIKVDNGNNALGTTQTIIDWMAMEQGAWTIDDGGTGIKVIAGTKNVSALGGSGVTWDSSEIVSFSPNFSGVPVVFHTVSSNNDSSWITSHVDDGVSIGGEPTTSQMGLILNFSRTGNSSHGAENIDYIAFDQGNGTNNGITFTTARATNVAGYDNSPPYNISYGSIFSSVPEVSISGQQGENGGDGSWSLLYGSASTQTNYPAVCDEADTSGNRGHTTETVGVIAFDTVSGIIKGSGVINGVLTSTMIDYDYGEGVSSWGALSWDDNETNGNIKYQLEYYSGGWLLIPDGDLAGNSTGFDTSPVDLHTLNTSTYNQIRVKANFTYSNGTPYLNDWTVKWDSSSTFDQSAFRWYENLDNLTPTTAWSGLEENSAITASDDPPLTGEVLRLRMAVQVGYAAMSASSTSFKLQYGQGSTCSTISTWYDVGQIASSTIWRGYNNAISGDGTNMPSTLLSVSEIAESYEEENNSVLNPNIVNSGQDGEWDWVIQNNGAIANATYCFRMVKSDGTLLNTYSQYPRLITNTIPNTPTLTKLFDNEKISTTTPSFKFSDTDADGDDLVYQFQWSTDFDFTSSTTKSSDSNQGFSNITTPTDNSPFDSGDVIQFKIQSGDALTNNTTYWWRVRAKDPNGTDQWSNWTTKRSLTVDTNVSVSTWFQTTDDQFDFTGTFSNTKTNGSGGIIIQTHIGEYGTTTVTGETANTITLQNTYTNLIVVASPRYGASQVYRDARIVNKTSTSFDIKVDNGNDALGTTQTIIDWMAMEQGAWTIDDGGTGIKVIAGTKNVSALGGLGGWDSSEIVSFSPNFSGVPIVFHTVSSNNDSSWITSHVDDGVSIGGEPTTSQMGLILNFSRTGNSSHGAENIDYIAFDQGNGTNNSITFTTARATNVAGYDNSPPYNISYGGIFSSVPEVSISGQQGTNGSDGSWLLLYGSASTQTNYPAVCDEADTSGNRSHTTETVGVIAFDSGGHGNIERYNPPSGIFYSPSVDYDDGYLTAGWGSVSWNDNETNGILLYQVEYWTGSTWSLVPDINIPGNSTGTSTSPINLTFLNTSFYNQIRIKASFTYSGGSSILNDLTIAWADNNPPTGIFNSESQNIDGSGIINISIEVDDIEEQNSMAKLEYVIGAACDFSSPLDPTLDEADENTTADYGDPKVENDNTYQIGNTSGWIETSSSSNTVFFDWQSQSDIPDTEGIYCLRLTANDNIEDQIAPATTTVYIDNLSPTAPGQLSKATSTNVSITLAFATSSSDTNFSEYKIFYKKGSSGVTESDILHGTSSDPNLAYADFNGATSTLIENLSAGTQYVFNIWAYDDYGNKANATEVVISTQISDDPPTGSFNSSAQKTDGSGYVNISIEIDDPDNDDTLRVKVEYEEGASCGFASSLDPALDETDANITADYGDPDIDNNYEYQVGTSTNWIITSPGSNTVNFDWMSKQDIPTANGTYCLRITANDGNNDQITSATTTLIVDNINPTLPGPLTEDSKTVSSITLAFGTSTTESHFSDYKIYYKQGTSSVSELDIEHDDADLDFIDYHGTATTTVSGLSAGVSYVFNIWAYDIFGNKASSTEVVITTNNYPDSTFALTQYKSDASTTITNGSWTDENEIVLSASSTDPDTSEVITVYFNFIDNAGSFVTATSVPANACASSTAYDLCSSKIWYDTSVIGDYSSSSVPFVSTVSITSISTSTSDYKWQAMSCDDSGDCSEWSDAGTDPNVKIDIITPTVPGQLSEINTLATSTILGFGASTTESNFSKYKIFYKKGSSGTTEQDIEHNDANLSYIDYNSATTTEVTGLSAGTQYVFNIWAYDLAGNKASSTELVITTTSSDNPPTSVFNSMAQKTDNSGAIDISIEVDDPDNDDTLRVKVEYVSGASCDFSSPLDPTLDETDVNITADYGDPDIDNNNEYQVGTTSAWIITSSGSNTVNFDWLSKQNVPTANGTYCLRIIANDGNNDQIISATSTLMIDNLAPTVPGALSKASIDTNSVTISFGSSSVETNFDEYRIFYKVGTSSVTEQDIEHIDANLEYINYNGATSTEITGLVSGTNYVFNIWAYDIFGNRASSTTELVVTTNSYPDNPFSLNQYKSDASTTIINGTWTDENEINLYATSTDQDAGDIITLYYELRGTGESFTTATTVPQNTCWSGDAYTDCSSKIWTSEQAWYNSSWQYRKKITIDASKVISNENNFPVLISITDSNIATGAQENGNDILFTSSDMITKLDHEIESYASSTGELIAWVKLLSISSSTDTELYIYYGNSSAGNQENISGVWNNNFTGVWHLSEIPDGTLDEITDSTGNGYDGTTYTMDSSDQIASQVNGGLDFDGTSDYIALDIYYNNVNAVAQMTTCVWFNTSFNGTSYNDNWAFLDFDRSDYFDFYIRGDTGALGFSTTGSGGTNDFTGNTSSLNDGDWHYGCVVYNGTDKIIYIDGEQDGTNYNTHSGDALGSSNIRYGFIGDGSEATTFNGSRNNIWYEGAIDELQYSETTRSAGWIKTSYNNQNSTSTFMAFDSEVSYSQAGATLDTTNITSLPDSASGYKWQTLACDNTGICSDWSDAGADPNFKVDITSPTAPGALSKYDDDSFSITLSFGASTTENNFSEYKIFYKKGVSGVTENDLLHGSSTDPNLGYIDYNGVATTTISNLDPDTDYVFNIWAYDLAGNKASSTEVHYKTPYSTISIYEYISGNGTGWTNTNNTWDQTNNTYASRDLTAGLNPDPANNLMGTANNATSSAKSIVKVEIGLEGYVEDPESLTMYFVPYFTATTTGATSTVTGAQIGSTDDDTVYYIDITNDSNAPEDWSWDDIINLDVKVFGGNDAGSAFMAYIDRIRIRVTSNSYPNNATNLEQFKNNEVTAIANESWHNENMVKLRASAIDPDESELITLYFQFIPTDQNFATSTVEPTNACVYGTAYTNCYSNPANIWYVASSSPGDFTVNPYIGTTSITAIPDNDYKWQVLACDDDGICADWVQYNSVTPNIKLDATAPHGLGALTYDSKTSISVTLSFGASTTEENFSEYRIYYKEGSSGVTESDIEHSDANLDYIDYNGSTTTTITNLSPSTQYVFNIWVYDLAGNKASSTEVTVTTNTTHSINQQSYLLENDDGSDVNSNTSEVSADTALTNVNKGQRINARIQIQNSGGDQTYYKVYKLQYEQTDEPGNWIDVGATAAISYSYGLSGSNNDVITSFKAATNSYTWSNGSWHENTYLTGTYNLFASYYTEFVFAIKTNNVELGKTYRLRLFNNTDGIPLDSYNSYPTITIASSETKRYSKSNLSSLPSSTSDLTYYFDAEGYSDVNADDNTNRDEIISSSNYPIVLFATKHTGNTDAITTTWNGQSTMAPTSASVVMQVYRFGSTNAWVTVASNATSSADSDFTISGNINSDLSEYYDGSYWTYWLIYQNSGSQTLKTDYFNVSFAPPVANVGQIHYRWRNDDGDEAGASWREAEDVGDPTTGTALEKGANVRLRLSTANIGGGNASNYAYKLEYASTAGNCSTDPGGWTAVPINYTGSEHFEMSTSTWFTNGTSTATRMINSENYTFINGTMTEDPSSTSSAITLAEDEYSEIEYVFKATATSTTGGTYCFRLTNNGSDLNYYNEYAEITLSGFSNSAPSFTVQPSDSGSASTTPTNNGDDINFTATASDAEGDDYYLAICKTNSITAGNNTPPNCNDGDWCISNVASSTVQANCSYTTDLPAFESRDWYAFVCDRRSGAGVSQCSSYSQGEISIASGSPFNINHAPSFTSISTQNDNQDPGSSFTITTISSDSDTEGGNDTLYLYVCRTNDATFSGGCSDDTVCSVTATSSPNATCYYNDIAPTLSGSYTYYAFIFDNHGMAATTNSQINSYTINNIKPVLGTLILNNGNDITLNIKGAADVQISASTTVSDQNGCIDLVSATAVIYMSNATNTYNCTGDYNDCYHINTSSCVKSDCIDDDDFTAVYTCTANIKYFAIPTDNSINNPWEPYNWLSRVIVYDGTYYEAATSSSVELISSIALNVAEETINYGTIGDNNDTGSINATTTIVNYGNTPINNNLYGIDMNRVPAGIISVDNQEYNLSPFVWGSGNDLATSSSLVDIIVPKPTSSDDVYDEIYWGIGIPLDTPPGDYSGNNTFSALLDQNGW